MNEDKESQGPSPKERAIAEFSTYTADSLNQSLRFFKVFGQKYGGLQMDDSKFFHAFYSEDMLTELRKYFSYSFDNEDKVNFFEIAEAEIFQANENLPAAISFRKIGRDNEAETLAIKDSSDPEDESLYYILENIKGEKAYFDDSSRIAAFYDKNGQIISILPFQRDIDQLTHDKGDEDNNISLKKSLLEQAESEDNFSVNYGASEIPITYDKDTNTYTLILTDSKNKPLFKLVVPKNIDYENIKDAVGFDKLIEDPNQPPDGTLGRSWGDKLWRSENFSDLTGIKLTPIDTDL